MAEGGVGMPREMRLGILGDYIFRALAPSPLEVLLHRKPIVSRQGARTIADNVVKEMREHPEKEMAFVDALMEDWRDCDG